MVMMEIKIVMEMAMMVEIMVVSAIHNRHLIVQHSNWLFPPF